MTHWSFQSPKQTLRRELLALREGLPWLGLSLRLSIMMVITPKITFPKHLTGHGLLKRKKIVKDGKTSYTASLSEGL